MKKKKDYTAAEKIAKFDDIYDQCLDELNSTVDDEEHDNQYFWEGIIEDVLGMTEGDWDKHNAHKKL